jgi:hypothetical protein
MAFWIGILIAGFVAYSAVKLGFYQMWTVLFNIVVSVYLAIHLSSIVPQFIPAAASTHYCNALCTLATGLAAFLILHGVSYVFLLGQFHISFPKIFDTVGAGILGFAAGFLVWSFATMLVCTTPVSRNISMKGLGFDSNQFHDAKMGTYIVWWCNLLDKVVLSEGDQQTTGQAINDMLKAAEQKQTRRMAHKASEPNEPNMPVQEKCTSPDANDINAPVLSVVERPVIPP